MGAQPATLRMVAASRRPRHTAMKSRASSVAPLAAVPDPQAERIGGSANRRYAILGSASANGRAVPRVSSHPPSATTDSEGTPAACTRANRGSIPVGGGPALTTARLTPSSAFGTGSSRRSCARWRQRPGRDAPPVPYTESYSRWHWPPMWQAGIPSAHRELGLRRAGCPHRSSPSCRNTSAPTWGVGYRSRSCRRGPVEPASLLAALPQLARRCPALVRAG